MEKCIRCNGLRDKLNITKLKGAGMPTRWKSVKKREKEKIIQSNNK